MTAVQTSVIDADVHCSPKALSDFSPYLDAYWRETVRAVGARAVVLIHWDDFFRPLDRPLRALPYAGDDLDHTMRVLTRLAADDGVRLSLPTVWRPEDPWRSA